MKNAQFQTVLGEENVALISRTVIINVRDKSRGKNPVCTAKPRKNHDALASGYKSCPLELLCFTWTMPWKMCYGQGSAKIMNIRNFFRQITCLRFAKRKKKHQKTNELIHETYNILNLRKLWLSQTKSVLNELRADSVLFNPTVIT